MEKELMTREELMLRCSQLERANLELQSRNIDRQNEINDLCEKIVSLEEGLSEAIRVEYNEQLKGTIRGLERARDKQQAEINRLNKKIMKLSHRNTGLSADRDKWKDSWREASEAARRAIIVYQEEHGFGDYRAAQAEIMQKYDAHVEGFDLYGKAVKGVPND